MSKLTILTALVRGGMTPIAACAMGGNMMCESRMLSDIVQGDLSCSAKSKQYTADVDAGRRTLADGSTGYGLCQWTLKSRQKKLYDFAKARGVSVGDETMQVNFCLAELRGEYPALWEYLTTAQDLYGAAARICKEYERPAVNNIADRANEGNALYMQYGSQLDAIAAGDGGEDTSGADSSLSGGTGESAALMPDTVRTGDKTPEAEYLAALLENLGYDVLWDGLHVCLVDYQVKCGIDPDGICGEKTWSKILNN
mgnify:CR=1 FL=1